MKNSIKQLFRKKPVAVIVVGMHRSGTSCLAGSLQQKGVFLGDVFRWNPHNLKGNRENAEIMKLNDKVLEYNNGTWDSPPSDLKWNTELSDERDLIIYNFLQSKKPVFGFKDPRTTFTLPFWEERLSNIFLVGSFRDPVSVAKSLGKRNNMKTSEAFELWIKYNSKLISLYNKYQCFLVNFDVEKDEYINLINRISKKLKLKNKSAKENIFYDEGLISNKPESTLTLPKDVVNMYDTLLRMYKEQQKYV